MRRFLFLLLFGASGVAILVALGSWQLRRLNWKQDLLAGIETRIAADPVALPAAPNPERDRYLKVTVAGTIEPGELRVLVSAENLGPGYRIVAPFVTDTGRRILLDRGFARDRDKNATRRTGAATITGNLDWPREVDRFVPDPDIAANIWFARDVPAMAKALDSEPILLVADAASRTDPGITPLPVATTNVANSHLQYAITWFALALIWAAMTALFLWRKPAKTEA